MLADLSAPNTPSTHSFAQLNESLKSHFEPNKMIVTEHFHVHRRYQSAQETIMEFAVGLRTLSCDCDIGSRFLNDALRDQFVCGLRSETIQSRLLSEENLTLQHALEIAQVQEAAKQDAHKFQDTGDTLLP